MKIAINIIQIKHYIFLLIIILTQTIAYGQSSEDLFKVRHTTGNKSALIKIQITKKISYLEYDLTLEDDSLNQFLFISGKIQGKKKLISKIWFYQDYIVWQSEKGENHVLLYDKKKQNNLSIPSKKTFWLVKLKYEGNQVNYRLKNTKLQDYNFSKFNKFRDSIKLKFESQLNFSFEGGNSLYKDNAEKNPSLQIDGRHLLILKTLPISFQYGITNEQSSKYKINYFEISFDRDRFQQEMRDIAIEKIQKEKKTLKNELESYKNDLIENSIDLSKIKTKIKTIEDSIYHIEDSINTQLVSTKNKEKSISLDSFSTLKNYKIKKNERLKKIKNELEIQKDKNKKHIDSLYQINDSLSNAYNNITKYQIEKDFSSYNLNSNKFKSLKIINSIEKLKIGKHSICNNYALGAIVINGGSVSIKHKNNSFSFSKGILHVNNQSNFSIPKLPSFNLDSFSNETKTDVIYLGSKVNINKKLNVELGFIQSNNNNLFDNINQYGLVKADVISSKLNLNLQLIINQKQLLSNFSKNTQITSIKPQKLIQTKAESPYFKNIISIYSSYFYSDRNFNNIGYKLLRTGTDEYQIGYKIKLFKSRFKFKCYLTQSIQELSTSQVKTKRIGIDMQVKIGRSAQAQFSYMPISNQYESTFNTGSEAVKTRLTLGQINYSFPAKTKSYNITLAIQNFDLFSSTNNLTNQNFTLIQILNYLSLNSSNQIQYSYYKYFSTQSLLNNPSESHLFSYNLTYRKYNFVFNYFHNIITDDRINRFGLGLSRQWTYFNLSLNNEHELKSNLNYYHLTFGIKF